MGEFQICRQQDDTDLLRHGLSYTTFALSNLSVANRVVTFKVKNTGSSAGAEILQLYVSAPNSPTQRPVKELHGFEKAYLQAYEEREVRIKIDEYATSFWDESEGKWCSEKGEYKVIVGRSSVDAESLEGTLVVPETRYWLGL